MYPYVHFFSVFARQLSLLPWVTNLLSIARCNLTFNSVRTTTIVAITPLDFFYVQNSLPQNYEFHMNPEPPGNNKASSKGDNQVCHR